MPDDAILIALELAIVCAVGFMMLGLFAIAAETISRCRRRRRYDEATAVFTYDNCPVCNKGWPDDKRPRVCPWCRRPLTARVRIMK